MNKSDNLQKLYDMTKDELDSLKGLIRDLLAYPSLGIAGPKETLGYCDTAHNGEATKDGKSFGQDAHQHNGLTCRNWKSAEFGDGEPSSGPK